ncbi:hypothetical protein [Crossiella sp. NPDC003009]
MTERKPGAQRLLGVGSRWAVREIREVAVPAPTGHRLAFDGQAHETELLTTLPVRPRSVA